MDYALLFVIFLLISEITCIVIYLSKYPEIFDLKYNDLTHDIYDSENKKDTEIVLEFERIFGKICKKILCFEPDFREFFTWIFCILMVLYNHSLIFHLQPPIAVNKIPCSGQFVQL